MDVGWIFYARRPASIGSRAIEHDSLRVSGSDFGIERGNTLPEGLVFKRGADIVLSVFFLIASLPLLAVAAIAIKLDSEGPVFFWQARMGRKFSRFKVLKLRTMCVHGCGPTCTLSEDPRITRTGRWLRWLKVDELPQLWNVLRGEMSLVGPRPVVPELAIEFREAYSRLLEVRPGLTDPATLKYCREEKILALVADPLSYYKGVLTPDKLRISTAYMERANVLSDLGVLVGTALALFPFNWRPQFILAWFSALGSSSEPIFAEPAQRAKAQPSIENI